METQTIQETQQKDEYTEKELNELSKQELKDICDALDLKVSGNMDELIQRILKHYANQATKPVDRPEVYEISTNMPYNRAVNHASRNFGVPSRQLKKDHTAKNWRFSL